LHILTPYSEAKNKHKKTGRHLEANKRFASAGEKLRIRAYTCASYTTPKSYVKRIFAENIPREILTAPPKPGDCGSVRFSETPDPSQV
jgi:hypothetical protein